MAFIPSRTMQSVIRTLLFLAALGVGSSLWAQPQTDYGRTPLPQPAYPPVNGVASNISAAVQEQPTNPNEVIDVRISGNNQIKNGTILKIINTRQGRPYNESTLEEDKRALMQKGWFFDVIPRVEKTPAGYIVTFQVSEHPLIHFVLLHGNSAHSKKNLLEEANIKSGDALDPIAVRQAQERIERFYLESGYQQANVRILSGDQIGDRGVVFQISEGRKQRILNVEFEGNTFLSSARLKTYVKSKPGWFFWVNSEFTRRQLDEDVETLTNLYRKNGFFYAKVDRVFVESQGYTGAGASRGWISVKFIIEEGPQCKIRDVQFVDNKAFSDSELKNVMKSFKQKNKYYNQDTIETDLANIKDKYGELGYVFAQTRLEQILDDEYVDLQLRLQEGPRCYVSSIDINIGGLGGAPAYTKVKAALNYCSVYPGDPLKLSEVRDTERRWRASQIFNANPTQGDLPTIRFDFPEEYIRAMEEAEALGSLQIRGQSPQRETSVSSVKQNNGAMSSAEYEANMEKFAGVFSIKPVQPQLPVYQQPPQTTVPQPYQSSPHRPLPQPVQQPQYQPMQQPVQPIRLTLNKKVLEEDGLEIDQTQPVYRGQVPQRTQPAIASYVPPNYRPPVSHAQSALASVPAQNPMLHLTPAQQTPVATADLVGYSYSNGGSSQLTSAYVPNPGGYVSPNANDEPSYYQRPTSIQQVNYTSANGTPLPYTGNQTRSPVDVLLGTSPNDQVLRKSATMYDPNAPPGVSPILYPTGIIGDLQETRTGSLMASIAVSSDSGLLGRFVIEEQNFDILNLPKGFRFSDWKNAFRGKGQRFRIEAMPGTEVQRYEASWQTPYLFDLPYSFGIGGYYNQRYFDEWYEDRIGGRMNFGKYWTPDFSTSVNLGGERVSIYRLFNSPADWKKGKHPLYTVGLSAVYSTRDSDFIPTEGHSISVSAEQVLGDFQFVRGNVDLRKYFMLHERPDRSGRWVLGLRSSLDVAETGAPFFERYYAGGFTSMRGFEYRSVTPRDAATGTGVGGCMQWINSAELIFPLTADDMVRGAFFVDTGTVESKIDKWSDEYRVSAGFGLRLTIPMMGPAPIALDFAFPIHKSRHDIKELFSFNVGFIR